MFSYLGAGMVLNEEKRNRPAEVIARRQATLTGAGVSAPAGLPPVAAPAQASPDPAPGDKLKGVVAIDSVDEDTDECRDDLTLCH